MRRFRAFWMLPLLCLSLNGFAAALLPAWSHHSTAFAQGADATHMGQMLAPAVDCNGSMAGDQHCQGDAFCVGHCAHACHMTALPISLPQLAMAFRPLLIPAQATQPSPAHLRALLRPPSGFIA